MHKIDIFGDGRKVPKLHINLKVKAKTESPAESAAWNNTFGYFMKKPRTKLDFISVGAIRNLPLHKVQLTDLKTYLPEEDYKQLSTVENVFNNSLTSDLKAFVLAIAKIKQEDLETIISTKPE